MTNSAAFKIWPLVFALAGLGIIAHNIYKQDQHIEHPYNSGKMVLNPNVTQENINTTICVPGFTKTIRPDTNYTNNLKKHLLQLRNESETNARLYELDHWIPLTLGGAPRDPDNLVLQVWKDAKEKDKDEFKLGRCVCAGGILLKDAQKLMSTWTEPLPESTYAKCPGIPNGYHH